LDLGSPSVSKPSSVGSPSVSGSQDRAVRSILKSPTPEGTPEEGSLKSSSEGKPQYYRGIGGKSMEIAVNYMKLEQAEGYGIFEYEVRFDPPVDSRAERYSAVNEHRTLFGPTKSFDGNKLYLPKQLPDIETIATSKHSKTGKDIKVLFRYKRQIKPGERESLYIYNLIFKKIMKILKFVESAKKANFFDPKAGKEIKEYKLMIWPGYITVVDEYEGGLYLQVDVANRVLRTETVMDIFKKVKKTSGGNFKDECEKALLGSSVITKYNNHSYKVDGIEFSESPKTEFTLASGQKISFAQYYQNQYGIAIADMNQPLLIHRPKVKGISEATVERIVKLVPELCFMTGMTDAMRADFKIMKEVGAFTRLTPPQRQASLDNFVKRIKGSPDAYAQITDWGLKLADSTVIVQSRALEPETIMFGKGYRETVRPNADWGRAATTKHVLTAVKLEKWAILFAPKNEQVVKNFCSTFRDQAPKMGIAVANPRVVKLKDDRTETYLKELKQLIEPSVQLVVTIFPMAKTDRYSAIKKLCCVEMPVASQVINSKTISNDKKLASVTQKVILQINCKLGGELWACPMPFKGLMIVGVDVYHDASRKGSSFAGIVSSMNDLATRYFSMVKEQKQGQEIMDALRVAFIESLIKYWEINRNWPTDIVVFRDGVGDGQLEVTKTHECEQFLAVFSKKNNGRGNNTTEVSKMESKLGDMLPENYKPGFVFVVVQKRINTRILAVARKGNRYEYANPPPGTVLDHSVTRFKYKDFFLVPQSVNQGTVSPTHFVVLKEQLRKEETSNPLDASNIQRLAYRLTHMYYNWPGTVRVPAPVQYAHKLVDLVGQHVHRVPAAQLSDKLFYL